MICRICNRNHFSHLYSFQIFKIYRCNYCYFTFVFPIPADLDNSPSSAKCSIQTNEAYTATMLATPDIRRRNRQLSISRRRYEYYAFLLGKPSFSLLEIGCGTASLAQGFISAGVSYHGIDIDNRAIHQATAKGIKNVRNIDFFDIPLEEKYDVICASQVLEHILSPVVFVQKVYCHLINNGIFHIDLPNADSLAGHLNNLLRINQNRYGEVIYPHHLFSYHPKTVDVLLNKFFSKYWIFLCAPHDNTWGGNYSFLRSFTEFYTESVG